ncbi:TPA: hypothetical protein N0F65_005505 [Lagenidium giganteum]|uniref:Bacterial Pleckstrin homology domain-containing protein n=1 Tax=Lagenidium giganteum TaxID=4803 RepID=A0AAV2YLM6_9STRA|nr:TPA: hypothetical protein N0F65_005505 [Lagenidium giganteum]
MLKGITSDLTGASDICRPVRDLATCQAAQYLLPNEQILFSLQSIKEEFTFTNYWLIKVYGDSATTTRKLVSRAEFKHTLLEHVRFETAGRVDRDVEIKFKIGSDHISIDIARDEELEARLYYKVLVLLSRTQEEREREWEFACLGLEQSAKALRLTEASGQTLTKQANETLQWLQETYERTHPTCHRELIMGAFNTLRTTLKMEGGSVG